MGVVDEASARLHSELEARLRFETLIADLSSKFINLPPGEVDREIEDAQRRVCECLGLDLSALWQWSAETPPHFTMTHLYRPLGGPPPPERIDGQELFPWCVGQLRDGRVVPVSSMESLPPQAARDQAVWRHYGIKSAVVFPLSAGGGQLIGALGFHTTRQQRAWPEDIVKRLQLVAQIFANALARKRADQELRESEERFRSLAVDLPGVVYQFYVRDDGERGMHYLGGSVSEVCGLSAEPLETFFERFTACIAAEDLGGWLTSVQESIDSVRPWDQEFRFIKPSGEQIQLRAFSRPKRLANEVVFSGVIRDITERKRWESETQRLRHELAHMTRVSTMGELAGSLAHELNQPLTAILSNAQAAQRFLARQPADLDEVRDILKDIAEEGRHAGEVISRLRSMLRKDRARMEPIDLNEVIRAVLGIMRSDLIVRNVSVSTALSPTLPLVSGDRVQLMQVLLNLIVNACDAMNDRPVVERWLTIETDQDGDNLVEVSVADRGAGILPEHLDQVFEPFFSTKAHGLGMGLPICDSIIKAHGGRLSGENNAGGGATFRFAVPAARPLGKSPEV